MAARSKSQRRYDRYSMLRMRLIDTVRKHIQLKSTHADMLADECRLIWDTKEYRSLTIGQRDCLREVQRCWHDRIYELHLVWRLGPSEGPLPEAIDGWYVDKDTRTPITHAEIQQYKRESYFGYLSREKLIYGGHYWQGSDRLYGEYKSLN